MSRIKPVLLAAMLILPVALYPTGPTTAMSATSSVDSRMRLDWEIGARHGRPVIQGWVYNDYGRPAIDVRLLVETLDASGNVIARRHRLRPWRRRVQRPYLLRGAAQDDRRLLPGKYHRIRLEEWPVTGPTSPTWGIEESKPK